MEEQKVIQIDITHVQPNPLQPRGNISPDSLQELVESIKEHGILEPLVIAKTPAGYQIIAGERRWRASKIVGLKHVPALIKETTPQGMLEMAIVENVQRSDLNPIERAKAFDRLAQEFNLSTGDISKKISKSASFVSNSLRLLKLPDALKDGLLSGLITEGHARALSAIDDTHSMIEAYKQVLKESASVRRAEELARRARSHTGQQPKPSHKPPLLVSEKIDYIQSDLTNTLGGSKFGRVKLTRSRAETKLLVVLKGNVEQTDPTLDKLYEAIKHSGARMVTTE
jgi:ParB family chromosome partitioning protein